MDWIGTLPLFLLAYELNIPHLVPPKAQNSTDDHHSTVIFSEKDGYWEESLVLGQAYFDYQLSGRHLLVTGYDHGVQQVESSISEALRLDVYAFNLEDCMQQMPTQFPSTSGAPSGSVSLVPCYPVNITISFDKWASHTTFDVKKLNANEYGDDIIVDSYGGDYWADSSQTNSWSLCLQEAEYQFSIYDTNGELPDLDIR